MTEIDKSIRTFVHAKAMTQQGQHHFLSSFLLALNGGADTSSSNSLSYHWRYAVIDCFDRDCNKLGLFLLSLVLSSVADVSLLTFIVCGCLCV